MEINLRCQFGRRVKDGKVTHPPTCQNRASGLWRVWFKAFGREYSKPYLLCAECGMHKMAARVRCAKLENDETIFYHDVVRVELIKSFDTDFKQSEAKPAKGNKHWAEAKVSPKADRVTKITLKRVVSRDQFKPMDIAAYRHSLATHDDGK